MIHPIKKWKEWNKKRALARFLLLNKKLNGLFVIIAVFLVLAIFFPELAGVILLGVCLSVLFTVITISILFLPLLFLVWLANCADEYSDKIDEWANKNAK